MPQRMCGTSFEMQRFFVPSGSTYIDTRIVNMTGHEGNSARVENTAL